jgi:xanthine dehydrogenase accessory factor
MQSLDLQVLQDVRRWRACGRAVHLVTVVDTWDGAPRPVGAIAAIRDDGVVVGAVSAGCVEADLVARVRQGPARCRPELLAYEISAEEASFHGLSGGGTLRVVLEPVAGTEWITAALTQAQEHRFTRRTLDLQDGTVTVAPGGRSDPPHFDGSTLAVTFGPRWRLLLVGAGELARLIAGTAATLDFEVLVCEPREAYAFNADGPGMRWLPGMPDEVVRAMVPDAHTAILALTRQAQLDELALAEARRSAAFYVGSLASAGLDIGGLTPAEIGLSILAEIIAVRNGVAPLRKKTPRPRPAPLRPPEESACTYATS